MLQLLRHSTRAARAASSRWTERTAIRRPLLPSSHRTWAEAGRTAFSDHVDLREQDEATQIAIKPNADTSQSLGLGRRKLPVVCPGCGAHSQTVELDEAGFYGAKRQKRNAIEARQQEEDSMLEKALASGALSSAPDSPSADASPVTTDEVPVCDRCHKLLHNRIGTPIIHPSMSSIQDIIEESPHKHNHIYHVLDAADFPMSLIPNLQDALQLPKLRTQNRRSKSLHFIRGRVAEVSFIITRSDLLAPRKEQVDALMPYLQDCLRDALGRSGKKLRLGNVRCVSAKRGWWTKNVKEDIWKRGGAGWMVGKVNVGKSALFEAVFPKGRNEDVDVEKLKIDEQRKAIASDTAQFDDGFDDAFSEHFASISEQDAAGKKRKPYQETELEMNDVLRAEPSEHSTPEPPDEEIPLDEDSLLPPAQTLTAYPPIPLISSLPGTTASPIRVPFGSNSKGELIDLPGIERSDLATHVDPAHHSDLIMHTRVVPEQQTLKPSQSLLLGGMIRITPKTPDQIFLAYAFTPVALAPHVSGTDKAVAIQTGVYSETGEAYTGTVPNVATESAKSRMKSAGTFKLSWDVTKRRAGPLTRSDAGKIKTENLPFRVYSADILIEGVGWVELVAQVRRKRKRDDIFAEEEGEAVPEVEVFSAEGKFVGVRRPMNAWLLGGPKKSEREKRGRGRMSINFTKRKIGGREGGKVRAEVQL